MERRFEAYNQRHYLHRQTDQVEKMRSDVEWALNDQARLNFPIPMTDAHKMVILKYFNKIGGQFPFNVLSRFNTYGHIFLVNATSISQFTRERTMQLVLFQSCLVFSLIKLLCAGGFDDTMLENRSTTFVRTDVGKSNHLRRQLQPQGDRLDEEELFPVIIGVNDGSDGVLENIFSRFSTFVRPKFKRIHAISALVSRDELDELKQDPNILYIEEDPMVYPDSTEASLYGLQMVQAYAPIPSKQNVTMTAACNNPESFKIGIVDSGLAM